MSLTPHLKKLLTQPPSLTATDLVDAIEHILTDATDIQSAAFLTALRITNLDHRPEMVAAAVSVLSQQSLKIDLSELPNTDGFVDIVGTGGDGQNTFNVSTTSAIIASGIGINVCKHGGKASTSASGAGDLMACLGSDLAKANNKSFPSIVGSSKFCFLFAPVFHPVMAKIAPLRKGLGIPSIFNILGPLLNPAPLKARIVGVYAEALGPVFVNTIKLLNEKAGRPDSAALVVWGTEGLDELSPAGTTKVWQLKNQQITEYFLHPDDFGLPSHSLESVASGTPQENAAIVTKLVSNELPANHPILDYVLMNTAALAFIDGSAKDWKHGVELARASIASGAAKEQLGLFVDATKLTGL